MKRSALILSAFAAVLAVSAVSAQEALIQANSALLQQVKTVVQVQKIAADHRAESAATPRVPHTFNLDFDGRAWRIQPNPNPPGSGMVLYVSQGEHVKLHITYSAFRRDDPTNFDIDDLDAVVDGKPSKGVHLWLQPNSETVVEFNANTLGIKLMRSPNGRIITTK